MTWMRFLALLFSVVTVSLAGCASPQATPAPPAPAAAPAAAPLPPEGTVRLTGDLREPGEITVEKLRAMTLRTVDVAYQSGKGPQQHSVTGVALTELLPVSALTTTDAKHDELSFAVLAIGADGYRTLLSYGEVSPKFGNRGILLTVTEDGTDLARPGIAVPGDVEGARYVHDVVELRVVRAEP